MSDQDFDFRPPPPRREPRRFEPPPWERDQFEELAREREEQRKQEEAALGQEPSGPSEDTADESTAPETKGAGEEGQDETGMAAQEAGGAERPAEKPEGPQGELDKGQVDLLMLNLQAEESETMGGAWLVGLSAGVIVALVGTAILIWGVAALANRKLGQLGVNGGTVLAVFGVSFIGTGAWVVYRSLRQRGVL